MLQLLLGLADKFPIYVVGGAVRDLCLGRASCDYDLLIPGAEFMSHLGEISLALGGNPFALSHEHQHWRYHHEDAVLDIAPLYHSLETDLARRDFTVNAMAMEFRDFVAQDLDKIKDFHLGRAHIASQTLVLTSPDSFARDALRIMRAARFMAELGFTTSSDLQVQVKVSRELLRLCPGERVWAELKRITVAPMATSAYIWLEQLGVLAALFPELEAEKGVSQNQHHAFGVYEHSWRAFLGYMKVWQSPYFLDEDIRERVLLDLGRVPMNLESVCKLASLLHDIGKPPSRGLLADGKVTFYRHEQVGASMIAPVAQRLRLASTEAKLLSRFVRWHSYLAQLSRQPRLHEGHLFRLAHRLGQHSIPMALFSVADQLAKGEKGANEESFRRIVSTVNRFFRAYYFRYDEVIRPPLPMNPVQLALALDLPPGKWLQETITYLEEQAARGNLRTEDKMIALAKQFCQRTEKNSYRTRA